MAKNTKRSALGYKIFKARKALHITQVKMAESLCIKRSTYARYELDTTPPIKILTKIGQILGLTTDELLTEEKNHTEVINENRSQLISLSAEHSYKTPNSDHSFTKEELDVLIGIIDLPKDKREELINYISEIIDENTQEE